jgi:hypothetical protein
MLFTNVQGKVELFKYIKISSNENQREKKNKKANVKIRFHQGAPCFQGKKHKTFI